MATQTITTTARETRSSMHLDSTPISPVETVREWQYAGPPNPLDPERFEAANNYGWDYAHGNPINPVRAGHNVAIRPFNSRFVYFRLQGVNVMGVRVIGRGASRAIVDLCK